ncbi:MAG TPA: arginase family protein, partial [Chloroflexota bacterium]|nr:arginase family protein [Chloroflexota bacterium]
DVVFGKKYSHSSPIIRAIEEGLIDPHRSIQIGIRGSLPYVNDLDRTRALGLTIVTVEELFQRGVHDVAAQALDLVGEKVYFTFDIDFVDPAFAPGTGTPEVGGPSSRMVLDLVRELRTLPMVAFDLVEVAPVYDHAEITGMLAANVMMEVLSILSWQKRHHQRNGRAVHPRSASGKAVHRS